MTNEDIVNIMWSIAPFLLGFIACLSFVIGIVVCAVQGELEYRRFKKNK